MPRIDLPDSGADFANRVELAEDPGPGKVLVVTSMHLMAHGAATVRFVEPGAADAGVAVDGLGPYPLQAAAEGTNLQYNPMGWGAFEDGIEAFVGTGTARVVGSLTYEIRDVDANWG